MLKKCPFCDKPWPSLRNTQEYVWWVRCLAVKGGCGAQTGYYNSPDAAIAAWYRHVKTDVDAEMRASIETSWREVALVALEAGQASGAPEASAAALALSSLTTYEQQAMNAYKTRIGIEELLRQDP